VTAAVLPRASRAGMVGSAVVHLILVAGLIFVARGASGPSPVVYSVKLLAAPTPRPSPRRAAEAATPTVEREVAPPEDPVREPEVQQPVPEQQVDQAAREDEQLTTRSDTEPLPGETPSTGSDELTFQQEGLQFQDREYLGRVVTEIRRRWVNPSGRSRLQATVNFTIEQDGSVSGVNLSQSSGNFTFNTEALGAIERTGRDGAFGPLPEGFNGVSLPIAFTFKPENK
jgi:TonB family protein